MSRLVLDSFAVIAYLENEKGAERVSNMIKQARDKDKPLLMSVINWGEVYYIVRRAAGKPAAEAVIRNLDTLPVEIVPVDRGMAAAAAEIKAAHKMSYADCFAAALAKLRKADLVTGDKEFGAIEGTVKIVWL